LFANALLRDVVKDHQVMNLDSGAGGSGDTGLRKWVSRLIIIAGLAWVVAVLIRDFAELRVIFRVDSVAWLTYTFAAGLAALLLTVPVFRIFLGYHAGLAIRYFYAAHMLFVAQILRHLPGRFWGILYLVRATKSEIPAAAMIRANLDVMFYSMAFNILIAGSLALAELVSLQIAVVAVTGGLLVMVVAIRQDWPGRFAMRLVRYLPARVIRLAEGLVRRDTLPWRDVLAIAVSFVAVWICYLSIWWALPRTFVVLAETSIWLLCASYSLAWVLGYLAMITPGGLGVREAGFVLLAAPLADPSTLTFLAIFIRVWQIAIEFMLFFAFAFVRRGRATDSISSDAATIRRP
jgi:hypothetical protein